MHQTPNSEYGLNIVLLCDRAAMHTGTVRDHIEAFRVMSRHRVHPVDARAAASLGADLSAADAVVLHYSLVICSDAYIKPALAAAIRAYKGPKILFIQDEYRWVDRTAEAIRQLGISVVFTVVNRDVIRRIYRAPWLDDVRFEETLTGFVPEDLCKRTVPPYASRSLDVSYRARRLSGWFGAFGQEKWIIGARFAEDARRYGLVCDIETSEASRIYGERWIDFVANSKAVLGTESGASFIDFSGDVQGRAEAYEKANPEATFEDVRDRFLDGRDGDIVIRVISPRCFEAAALRTLMIMYPGTYSGALEANRHYVPLARDHSNMDEVVAILRDPVRAGDIIERAYREVACSPRWTFRAFIARFDDVVAEVVETRSSVPAAEATATLRDLARRSMRMAGQRVLRMKIATSIMRAGNGVERSIARWPAPIARPVLKVGRSVLTSIKPVVRRIIVGR